MQTAIGAFPNGWNVVSLGEISEFITSGSRGWAKYYAKAGPLFIRSQNVRDGRIDFTDRQCVIPPLGGEGSRTRLNVRDLLITITGNSVGNVAWVSEDIGEAYISQHVGLVRLLDSSAAEYVCIFLAPGSPGNEQIWASQAGQSKPGLNLSNLDNFLVAMPPESEQRAIATALSDVDALLAKIDQIIAKKRDLKQAAMQQLLTGQTRLPGFSGEWEVKRLGDLLSYEQPTPYLVKSAEYDNGNSVPVLTAGKTFILGYTNETEGVYLSPPVIIFDDFTTASKFVDFTFKAKSSAMKILKAREGCAHIRFAFERMQIIDFQLGDHKRYWISEYSKLPIETPSLVEQTAISSVLSDMDAELAALEARRDKTRALKQGMMQALLTGRIRLVGGD